MIRTLGRTAALVAVETPVKSRSDASQRAAGIGRMP
jgi:hypothetical protein